MDPVWPKYFQPDAVREGFGTKLSSYVLALEAWRRGLTVTLLDPALYKIRIADEQGKAVTFTQSRPDMTTKKAHAAARNKHLSNRLLDDAGVSVPKSVLIDPKEVSVTELQREAENIGYPVVIKPRNGAMGRGVFANIENSVTLEKRYTELTRESPSSPLVLERHVPGDDYRVLVFGNEYIGAVMRVPANISGDGRSTVNQLIHQKNQHRLKNPFLSKGLIRGDQEVADNLEKLGYGFSSVPSNGEYIRLRSAANASAGGDVIDVTDKLPKSVQASAVEALKAVPGLYCAGVDVLFDDSPENINNEHAILELNSQPQIGVNMYPTHGAGVDVPRHIIDICFPEANHPRKRGDRKLSLRLRPSLQPLASGHLSEVTLSVLPSSRFRSRKLYDLEGMPPLSVRQRARILRASRDNSIAGFIRKTGEKKQLMAAGTQAQIDNFIKAVSSITGGTLRNPTTWKGAVYAGFVYKL